MGRRRQKNKAVSEDKDKSLSHNGLYKVRISTDIMVVAKDYTSAIEIGNKFRKDESVHAMATKAYLLESSSEIPDDWKGVIPYHDQETEVITKICSECAKELGLPEKKLTPTVLEETNTVEIIKEEKPSKPAVIQNTKPNNANQLNSNTLPVLYFDIPSN